MVRRVALLLLLAAVAAPPAAAAPRLKAFDSCGALIRYAQRHADRIPAPRRDLPESMPAPVSAPDAGEDHSSTNVQEGGVDEADSVKTDGRRLFVVAGGSLHAIDARAATPRVLSSLALPEDGMQHELLVHRDRLLVISRLGDDLLLGVGQDATAEGRTRGTQLSLFDISDPRRPRRLHQQALAPGSSSAVEWDHRAFLHWPRTGLAVLPVDTSAAGFRVARRGIEPVGAVSQQGVITRSAVIGDRLFTVSECGVTASPLSTLRGGAWLPFGQGAP